MNKPNPAPLSDFDRALRAIVATPKSAVVKAEQKSKGNRKSQASKRKGK